MPNVCEAINGLVEERLRDAFETGHTINVPHLASEMTESLADLIVCGAPPEEQPRLIAHVVAELGRFRQGKARGRCGRAGAVVQSRNHPASKELASWIIGGGDFHAEY